MPRYSFQRTNPAFTGGPEQFNIVIEDQDEHYFLGGPLPVYDGPAGFIQYRDASEVGTNCVDQETSLLFDHLSFDQDEEYDGFQDGGNVGANIAAGILDALGYQGLGVTTKVAQELILEACGKKFKVQADTRLFNFRTGSSLVIATDDIRRFNPKAQDPESQLIACAFAAFQRKVRFQKRANVEPSKVEIIHGFTMNRTLPTFYKIPVTAELEHAVRYGQLPATQTVVYRHTISVPVEELRNEGIHALPNREYIIRCFQAFRGLVWSQIRMAKEYDVPETKKESNNPQ